MQVTKEIQNKAEQRFRNGHKIGPNNSYSYIIENTIRVLPYLVRGCVAVEAKATNGQKQSDAGRLYDLKNF